MHTTLLVKNLKCNVVIHAFEMSTFESLTVENPQIDSLESEDGPATETVADAVVLNNVNMIKFEDALTVQYCPTCGFPPEYCSYGANFDACLPWILENAVEVLGM